MEPSSLYIGMFHKVKPNIVWAATSQWLREARESLDSKGHKVAKELD